MGYEDNTGLNVNNHYGARTTGHAVGVEHNYGSNWTLKIDITGQSIEDAIAGFVPPVVVPKGANFNTARIRVDEAFVVTGTNPTLIVGAVAAPGTNGVVITEAELENVGTKEIASTGAGTWAFNSSTGTTAASKIGFSIGGTGSPAIAATSGKATLILEYTFNTKV